MSGEWDYNDTHSALNDYADRLETSSATNPLHCAYAAFLRRVSEATKELTWELSNDSGEGDADSYLRGVLSPSDELVAALELANNAAKRLQEIMERANRGVSRLNAG